MPRVPQVAAVGAPNTRFSAPAFKNAAPEQMTDLGGGLQQAGGAVSQVAGKLAEEANDVRVRGQFDKYMAQQHSLTYDPEVGYIHLKGEQALTRPDKKSLDNEYGEKLDEVAKNLLAELDNDAQRQTFQNQTITARRGFLKGIEVHVAREFGAHREGVELAGNNTARQVIVQARTPEEVIGGESRIMSGVDKLAEYRGLSPEEKALLLKTELGPAYSTRIAGLIDNGRNVEAALLLGEKKQYLEDRTYEKLNSALLRGTQLEKAQTFGDEIIANGMTETDALAEARQRFSGEEEKMATQHVKDIFAAKHQAQVMDARAVSTKSWSKVMETNNMPPPALLADLREKAPEEERQMRDWLEAKQRRDANEGAPTDWDKYYNLRRMSVEEPAAFTQLDLMKFRPYLHNSEFKRLTELQAGISKADAKAMQQQAMVRKALGLVKGELASVGIDLTPKEGTKQAQDTAQFLSALTLQLDEAAQAKGSPLTEDETRRVSHGLLKEGIEQGSGIFGFMQTRKRGYQIVADPDNKATYVEANFDDIPPEIRTKLIQALGLDPDKASWFRSDTRGEIERMYTRGRQQGRF